MGCTLEDNKNAKLSAQETWADFLYSLNYWIKNDIKLFDKFQFIEQMIFV